MGPRQRASISWRSCGSGPPAQRAVRLGAPSAVRPARPRSTTTTSYGGGGEGTVEGQDLSVDDLVEPVLPGLIPPEHRPIPPPPLLQEGDQRRQRLQAGAGPEPLQQPRRPQRAEPSLAGPHAQAQPPQQVLQVGLGEGGEEALQPSPADQLALADQVGVPPLPLPLVGLQPLPSQEWR